MRFIVYFLINGIEYHRIVKGGRSVQALKKRYKVFKVSRY